MGEGSDHSNTSMAPTPILKPLPSLSLRRHRLMEITPWKPNVKGPTGHIIAYTHSMAAAVDANLCIYQARECPLPTLEVPWQHLKPLVKEIGIRARNAYAATQRTLLGKVTELDMGLFRQSAAKSNKDDRATLEWAATLSAWTEHEKESIGQALTTKCPHCGLEQTTIEHIIWSCKVHIDKAQDRTSTYAA